MKQVKIFANANHEALEALATEAVNDPNFLEIHYGLHAILVVYHVPDDKEASIHTAGSQDHS
ncbi:MAG TPA: hypothetical protein VKR32_02150 [Puia sp.]|nr:hypothetical protein [Puia sp.]